MIKEETEELYKIAKFVLKRNNIPYDEDLVQDLVSDGYKKLQNNFDATKAKKTTFLYMVMYQRYLYQIRKNSQERKIPNHLIISLNKVIDNNNKTNEKEITLSDIIPSEDKKLNKAKKEILGEIYFLFKPATKLKIEGYNQYEISKKLNISQAAVSRTIQKDIEKASDYLKSHDLFDYYRDLFLTNYLD